MGENPPLGDLPSEKMNKIHLSAENECEHDDMMQWNIQEKSMNITDWGWTTVIGTFNVCCWDQKWN